MSLRELHRQIRNDLETSGDAEPREMIVLLRECGLDRALEAVLNDALLALAVVPNSVEDTDSKRGGSESENKSPHWVLLAITRNIEIRDDEIKALVKGPCAFEPASPDRFLLGDLSLEDQRLLHKEVVREDEIRELFQKIVEALERLDLQDSVTQYLRNTLLRYGTSSESFVAAKFKEIIERQLELDPRQLREETRGTLLRRRIAERQAKIGDTFNDLAPSLKERVDALGGLSWDMQHLEAVRRSVFVSKDDRLLNALIHGRLFDRGLLGRLSLAADHLRRVLKKFDDYVGGYAITGSWITRGDDARSDSDLDVLILINDFDVQKLGRVELSKRCHGITQAMAVEAANDKGMPATTLHCTLFLLTDALRGLHAGNVLFWSMLEKAFVLHDPHMYLRSWQFLLGQGALGPSEVYAEEILESARTDVYFTYRRIRECIVDDLYAGVLKGAQSLLLRLGARVLPPDGVVQNLRKKAGQKVGEHTLDGLGNVADCLAQLRELYQRYKRSPSLQIKADQLHDLMQQSEGALRAIESLCALLGHGCIGKNLTDVPVVDSLE